MKKPCKDCGSVTRKVTPPGPRCATCHRARKKVLQRASHARWVEKTYRITGEQYWKLYDAQGGVCAICQVATGATKALAVDHDHACCPGGTSCGKCTRGLLCSVCNKLLGFARDKVEFFERAIQYLKDPPGKVKPNES